MLIRAALCGVVVALAVAGCSADSLPKVGPSIEATGAGAAYPSTTAAVKDEPFNPFADPHATASGGREVISSPTKDDIMATSPLPEMAWGRPDAPVTIVQYASLTCPHCKSFHAQVFPELKRTYIDTGKVRYILREFPIGKTSGAATIALRCAPPEKYLNLYGRYMDQQSQWVSQEVRLDAVFKVAAQVGMTRAQFDACRENQAMIEGLKWVKERGRKLGIIGTPNFFIETKLVKSVLTMNEIKAMVEPVLAGASSAPVTAAQ